MLCAKGSLIRCVRCKGRKKVFKVNSVYSLVNTGGVQVDCPMCLGTGVNKPILEALLEVTDKKIDKQKSDKIKQKDCKDAERTTREDVDKT